MSLNHRLIKLNLYGTLGCHLCEQAQSMVASTLPEAQIWYIDIARDEAMVNQLGCRIPVIEYNGVTLDWPFTAKEIRKLVFSTQPRRYLLY